VLGGAGGYNTLEVVELAKELKQIGVDGLLSVTPYYNKPNPEGLYQHYKAIAAATPLPVIVYSIQGRTGINVEPSTLKRLAEIDTIIGVKEASGNISQMAAIAHMLPKDFALLCGDDSITIPLISLGGVGVISVVSNEIPAEMTRLVDLARKGDLAGARAIQRQFFDLMAVNFIEPNPAPCKAAMAMMGLLEETYRLPMVPVSDASRARIEAVLKGCGLAGAGASLQSKGSHAD
jgi:4-hydroxy-tetrahydrodipicolinate synthase